MKDWKKIGPVTLKDTALDRLIEYDDIYEFCRREARSIAFDFDLGDDTMLNSVWRSDAVGKIPGKYRYLLLDESGLIIPLWKIGECLHHIQNEFPLLNYHYRYYYERTRGCKHRYDPIPGTGHRVCGRFYRRPKTTSERRAAVGLRNDEDARYYGVKARPCRSNRALPTIYDDIPRGNIRNSKNWKQNRKKRWTNN